MLIEVMDRLLAVAPVTVVSSLGDLAAREMASEYEAASGNSELMWVSGKFVEAEQANVNGAFWDTADLEYGEHSIVHAPVNFLHQHRNCIGVFTESKLFKPGDVRHAEAAASTKPFMAVNAALWKEFFPYETRMVEMASDAGLLFWSMECQSQSIRCETSGDGKWTGCGKEYPFEQWAKRPESLCTHMQEKSAQRHFVQPRFNAGAVIVPPVRPGWREAKAQVREHAESLAALHYAEAAAQADLPDEQLVSLMEQVVRFGESLNAA